MLFGIQGSASLNDGVVRGLAYVLTARQKTGICPALRMDYHVPQESNRALNSYPTLEPSGLEKHNSESVCDHAVLISECCNDLAPSWSELFPQHPPQGYQLSNALKCLP